VPRLRFSSGWLFLVLGAVLIASGPLACAISPPPRTTVQGASIEAIRERGVLRAGLRQDLPRFAYLEPMTNRWDGFEVAIARELAAAILGDPGKLELVRVTDTQRVPYLRDGSVDIVVAQLGRTTSSDIAVSRPYFVSGVGALVPRSGAGVTFDDVRAGPMCVVKRSTALDALRATVPTAGTLLVDTPTECLPALAAGSVAAAVADLPTLVRLALEAPPTAILPTLLEEQPLVVGVPTNQPDLLRSVDEALSAIRESGRWAALHRQYFEGLLPLSQPPA
jgi:polar amino acid transport system substrate-binding protein